jgi:hypothetical protein
LSGGKRRLGACPIKRVLPTRFLLLGDFYFVLSALAVRSFLGLEFLPTTAEKILAVQATAAKACPPEREINFLWDRGSAMLIFPIDCQTNCAAQGFVQPNH